jgi:glycosyltransferase involved in cell wall biosynthesis
MGGKGAGGVEKHTIELSKALKRKGVDVTIIAHESFREFFEGFRFIGLDLTKCRYNVVNLFKLYRILKRENFDIVHTQANKATAMVALIKPMISSKFVATLHSYKNNLWPFNRADFVITVSDRIGEPLKNEHKTTIYNGVQFDNIEKVDLRQRYSLPQNSFLVCAVGRLAKVKAYEILIRSMCYTDDECFLLLVGDGIEHESLTKLTKQLRLENKVYFLGHKENDEVKKIIASSDLLAISSQKEGFPYVFVETLLSQTPVISTDVSDIKKFITEKYIVKQLDEKNMAEKIMYVKNHYDEILEDFQKIFIKAAECFTVQKVVDETLAVYRFLVDKTENEKDA